jgi:hypothetical protein
MANESVSKPANNNLPSITVQFDSTAVIGSVLFAAVLFKTVQTKIKAVLQYMAKVDDDAIRACMATLLGYTKADRVLILLLHNGSKLETGISYKKLSCCYEQIGAGFGIVSSQLQNKPASLFSEFLIDEPVAFTCLQTTRSNNAMADFFAACGAECGITAPLYSDGKRIGLLLIQWVDSTPTRDTVLNEFSKLNIYSIMAKLGSLLKPKPSLADTFKNML